MNEGVHNTLIRIFKKYIYNNEINTLSNTYKDMFSSVRINLSSILETYTRMRTYMYAHVHAPNT